MHTYMYISYDKNLETAMTCRRLSFLHFRKSASMHMDEENRENEKSRHHCGRCAYFTTKSLIIRSELASSLDWGLEWCERC
jgi:hypothetical protein